MSGPTNDGPQIGIHIGELVVDGPRGLDRQRFVSAVEAELGRLVGGRALRPEVAKHARIDGGTIALSSGGARQSARDSAAVGRSVARAVYGAIGGGR